MRPLPIALLLSACLALLTGCASASTARPAGSTTAGTAAGTTVGTAPALPALVLPPSPLLALVPAPGEAPAGMLPLLMVSGPRDLAAVAAFSTNAGGAASTLTAHGFTGAYAVQYADPADGRVLSVVASQFRDEAGATADLAADEAAQDGTPVTVEPLGADSQARRSPLPGKAGGELFYLRFRSGATTWLLAYGARPTADPAVGVALARMLLARATT